ncbi:MAG: hypothetical protein ACRDQ4_06765 [Pseudonocardiaceae bacterium]
MADTEQRAAATTKMERSGPAIRAILTAASPAEAVLGRWWAIAAIRANPLSEQEQAQLARARTGDFTGLWERDKAGNWAQL